jgi:hypothetical protein
LKIRCESAAYNVDLTAQLVDVDPEMYSNDGQCDNNEQNYQNELIWVKVLKN